MEFPRRAVTVERVLAALALAAALGAAWALRRSPLAESLRDGRPWLAWVEARQPGAADAPEFLLAVYSPDDRRLVLLDAPGSLRVDGKRTLEQAYRRALRGGAPGPAAAAAETLAEARLDALTPQPLPASSARLSVSLPPLADEDEPAVETARALVRRASAPEAWARLLGDAARGLLAGRPDALDPVLFALELRRLPPGGLRPARLPDEDGLAVLLGRALSRTPAPDDGRAIAVEILNGTGTDGLASRAAKMLRLRGVDVLAVGDARPRARTLVVDRVGDFRRAETVLETVGCPDARAVTRLDATRAVDVSVLVGADCADALGPAGAAGP